MKIGIVLPYNIFRPGGVQNQVEAQVAELSRRGYEVRVVTPHPQGQSEPAPKGVVFVGQSARIRAPQHTLADVSAVGGSEVEQVLEAEKFDLLHIHEPLIPILAMQMLSKVSCPTIGTFHAALPDTFLAQVIAGSIGPYKRQIFKKLNAVTAVSEAAMSYLANEMERASITVIPNGINVELFSEPEVEREPQTVLFVGRLEKRKGVRYLLSAWALVEKQMPDAKLIIAGDGPERNMLESRTRQLKLQHVEFLGRVTDEEKRRLLRRCTVYTSPALYGESFGIVLLEAMAAGAVTVAGANPGYESVLTGTGRLSLVDPKATPEVARRLVLLMSDKPLRKAWQTWARREVARYDFGSVVDDYEQLYQRLAPARR
jgi:phosphatidylinositol alpha-mannosyltransferase